MPGRRGLGGALAAIGCVAVLMATAPGAGAYIYWANTQTQAIGRAENDGSGVDPSFLSTGKTPIAMAVDGSHIYWANRDSGSIGRANLDGSAVDNSFIENLKEPDAVAINDSSIYWSTVPGPIGRADLNGSNPNPAFITGAQGAVEPCGLALDSGHLYWSDIAGGVPAYIGRASLDGLVKEPHYVTIEIAVPCGVAVNSANIFWADTGLFGGGTRIGRADTNGGKGVDMSFIGTASTPCGLALDEAQHLFWANGGDGTIGRANTDGTAVNEQYVQTGAGAGALCGVAVDGRSSPPPPPGGGGADATPPDTKIVAGPGSKLARGRARFSFRSSEPGSRFLCRLDKGKQKPCSSPRRYTGLRPGRHTFRVWAIDAAGNRDATPARRRFRVPRR